MSDYLPLSPSKCLRAGAAAIAVAIACATPHHASAQSAAEIKLESNDGSVSIVGELRGVEENKYIVDTTAYGMLSISIADVTCTGILCPEIRTEAGPVTNANFGIYGSRTVGTTLIPTLLRGYAASVGADYEIIATPEAAERVVRLTNPDGTVRAEIDLQTRGSGSAFPALAEGVAAIGVADRRMKDSDVAKLAVGNIPDLRDTANETVLGVDGIVMITHPDNPVRNLSPIEVAKVWSGEITNWRELGGGNIPISVKSFGEGSGDRAVLLDALVRPSGRDETAQVERFSAYQDLVDSVMEERGAIGYVGRWLAATNDVNMVAVRETCGLISAPTDFRMKIEGYSLSRRLYAYTPPTGMHPEAKAFLDWTLTPEAQPYIAESHFIDRDLERMRLEDMGMMLVHTAAVEPDFSGVQYSDMMRKLRGADRLSVSFRFETGSSRLDVESERNVEELARRIQRDEFEGMEVLLVGFADAVGDRDLNTGLAQDRSNSVERILRDELVRTGSRDVQVRSMSFGELLPLSCNDTDIGRERNRRVEVWLRLPEERSARR